ncbi:hypothetical protein [Leptolyngbya sp. BL0902]|uniref:hypothetical protein n=1 Tax=Leptolyngbya sp. BL0902 TaxID=1115757 RepID=UPI0018E874CC|nr:hypothetical protein [Leptolyngbya sp. BL0902]
MPSPLDSLTALADSPAHAIECKFLFERDLYTPCHIWAADVDHRLSAVYVDNQFYSFFKVVGDPNKLLDIVARLGKRDDKVAITLTKQGYAIWAYEPQAQYAPPARQPGHRIYPVFGPKNCLLLIDPQAYQLCQIQVPDVAKPLDAIAYRNRYYSIFKQDQDAARLLDITAKLARRGDDTLLTLTDSTYRLGLLEPSGRVI